MVDSRINNNNLSYNIYDTDLENIEDEINWIN